MKKISLEKLKYPIGHFKAPTHITDELLKAWIETITLFPKKIEQICSPLNKQQLQWRYRPNGWMIKQVVHHCADSHMNSYIRFKWALTEKHPTIKAYDEVQWAELPDSLDDDLSFSLSLLEGLHHRWSSLLLSLDQKDFDKGFIHPASEESIDLRTNTGIYAWHCEHHLAHIRQALEAAGTYN